MGRMDVFLVTPERELWSGEASIVIARGSEGELGIMAGHAPLLIQLGIGPLFIQTEGERLAAAVDGGFLHVMSSEGDSRVDILAEHAELAREIDVQRAQQRLEEARRRVSGGGDEEEVAAAQADVAKAETRINLSERS
jgi:F-type H+-transporting ATPase subunit epsilon